MIITKQNKKGEFVKYNYTCIGKDKVPVTKYYSDKIAKRRQMERFNRDKPKVLVKEVPEETVSEMKSLKEGASMSFAALSRIYQLSPYIIKQALKC
jgi:hypothetical protein